MKIFIDDIIIKKNRIIEKNEIIFPNSGVVLVKGKNGTGKTLFLKYLFEKFKKNNRCVFLDQNNDAILTKYNILENIGMTSDRKKLEKIKKELINLGFSDLLSLNSLRLSGGEKRIISFFRIFFSDNQIFFLDEPTNDLDYEKVEKILSLIIREVKIRKKLFLIASHDDRVSKLSNIKINIIDKKLFCSEKESPIKSEYIRERNSEIKNYSFINKGIKTNFMIVFLFIFIVTFMIIKTIEDESLIFQKTDIRSDQLDIFTSLSTVESILSDEHAIPIKFIDYIEEFNLIKKYDNYKKIEAFYRKNKQEISFDLDDFENNDKYSIYKLEFLDIIEKKGYNTLNLYLDSQGLNHYEYYADSEKYFSQAYLFDKKETKTHKLNQQLFLEKIAEIEEANGENLHVLAISIVFDKKMSYNEFLKSEDFLKLKRSGNYFITSKKILEYRYMQRDFLHLEEKLKIILYVFLVLIAIEIFYIYLYFINNKKNISLFKNFNYDKLIMEKILRNKLNNRMIKLILLFLTFLINYSYSITFKIKLLDDVFLLLLVFYLSFSFYLSNKIINVNVKKIYRWNYRC